MSKPAAHHRHDERAELARLFQTGASVQMLAPRRIGKTWLMDKVADDLEAQGWLCIRIDVEGMRTEEEFLRALCSEIERNQDVFTRVAAHALQRIRQLKGGGFEGTLIQSIGQIDSKQFSAALIDSLDKSGKRTLILIDEISLFVMERARQDPEGTRAFLYHLRKLRQDHPNVVWLLTGSIGLDIVSRDLRLAGALIGLDIFPLEQFTTEAARSFIEELCVENQLQRSFDFGPGAFEFLASELGWLSPYYLKLIARLTRPSAPGTSGSRTIASVTDVAAAFVELLKPAYRSHFAAWEEHIEKNFAEQQRTHLRLVLDILCENVDGEIEPTLLVRYAAAFANAQRRELTNVLTSLANDGFVEKSNERWRFRSGLLRRYWVEYLKA